MPKMWLVSGSFSDSNGEREKERKKVVWLAKEKKKKKSVVFRFFSRGYIDVCRSGEVSIDDGVSRRQLT